MRNREPTGVLGTNVHPVRPLTAVRAAIAASLLAALCVCLAAAPAGAAPALNWRVPLEVDAARALNGVSCASDTLCAAVDETGNALISTNPTLESWPSPQTIDAGHALKAVSCAPSSTLCVAVDGEGRAVVTGNAGASWSKPIEIDGTTPLTGVSCASTTLCVAVDESGQALVSATPGVPTTGSWSQHTIDAGHKLAGVSCAPGLPCVAVDDGGRVLVSNEPASGWAARTIDSAPLVAISCASAPANVCVAVDATGDALASSNPGAAPATWNATPVDAGPVAGVSCSAAGLCVLVDESGDAYVSDDPAAGAPSWRFESIDAPDQLAGVSCVAEGLCVAVDKLGHVLFTLLPPPVVGTGAPTIGETVATLAGTVDTNDAMLTSCRFEYGVSEAYGQSAPCPTALAAGSANQPVSAALSGLAANVTYDYRLVATSASGAGITANATFKTTAPPLVQPHPSISGIPALGQHLTCKSGVSGSGASSATLSYAWLRDTKAISGANGSTYLVASADVSHHLQCRVTATNVGGSASATSAFVTVPAGGLGSISETQVGTLRVAGRTVSVPVTCSAQAAGSCTIRLRLTAVETLRGGHVIAVAARRTSRKTVTVGSVTTHVPAGKHATVTVALNATGRSLLAHFHKLSAKLSVSGTVVGAISAQLRNTTVTLGAAGKASSRRRR